MKDLFLAIVNIFRAVGKILGFIRNAFFNLLLLAMVAVATFVFWSNQKEEIGPDSILRLDITGTIVEQKKIIGSVERFFGSPLDPDTYERETSRQDILDVIKAAAQDERIVALLLNLKHLDQAGMDQLQSIAQALNSFRQSGKKVIAAEDYYTQSQYYLAAHADQVILNPLGGVDLHGFGVYRLYFREALDKLLVNYHIFKVGSYKSALEPITRSSMSAADRQQNEAWLAALWTLYSEEIARQRGISRAAIRQYTDNIDLHLAASGGDTAKLALTTGLVDSLQTRGEIRRSLAELTENTGAENLPLVGTASYLATLSPSFTVTEAKRDKIALIIAEGTILPGRQPPGGVGGDSLAATIREARRDKQVKALVLRINSPGGSAFASEIIRQELLEVQENDKPVVVSMGSVAASGGYWIAADADEIWASPATLTGSIGIFGAVPTFEKSLAALGIHADGTGTTPLATGFNLTQPMPEQLSRAIQQTVAHNYQRFLEIVAEGRGLEMVKVRGIADGRVYDGRAALNLGLVDRLGGLEEAIASAATLAGVSDYDTELFPSSLDIREHLSRFLESWQIKGYRAPAHPILARIERLCFRSLGGLLELNDPRGVYAYSLINFNM